MSHEKKNSASEQQSLLKDGYVLMSGINSELAEEGLSSDEEAFKLYESALTECE